MQLYFSYAKVELTSLLLEFIEAQADYLANDVTKGGNIQVYRSRDIHDLHTALVSCKKGASYSTENVDQACTSILKQIGGVSYLCDSQKFLIEFDNQIINVIPVYTVRAEDELGSFCDLSHLKNPTIRLLFISPQPISPIVQPVESIKVAYMLWGGELHGKKCYVLERESDNAQIYVFSDENEIVSKCNDIIAAGDHMVKWLNSNLLDKCGCCSMVSILHG